MSGEDQARQFLDEALKNIEKRDFEQALSNLEQGFHLCAHEPDSEVCQKIVQLHLTLTSIEQTAYEAAQRQAKTLNSKTAIDDPNVAELAETLKRQSLRIGPSAKAPEKDGSRFGGQPFAPRDLDWPTSPTGAPLHFLCQVALKDLKGLEASRPLPDKGWLLFFYEAESQPWGFDPAEKSSWRVLYFEENDKFIEHEFPLSLSQEWLPNERAIEWSQEMTYPSLEADEFEGIRFSDDQADEYVAYVDSVYGTKPWHRLLGHPQLNQNDWRLECQLASHGIYCGDASGYSGELATKLSSGAGDWQLLLQIDSEDDLMWGDGGCIYFCITKKDLETRQFDKVWLILQCY